MRYGKRTESDGGGYEMRSSQRLPPKRPIFSISTHRRECEFLHQFASSLRKYFSTIRNLPSIISVSVSGMLEYFWKSFRHFDADDCQDVLRYSRSAVEAYVSLIFNFPLIFVFYVCNFSGWKKAELSLIARSERSIPTKSWISNFH